MDIKAITRNILVNYDHFTELFLRCLKDLDYRLVFRFQDLEECIVKRKVYACSLNKKRKYWDCVWPIMIGSKLDVAIRKQKQTSFLTLEGLTNLLDEEEASDVPDIAITTFVVNGIPKHVPCFVTNDATNIHVVRNAIVRMYRYNAEEKGFELNLYVDNEGEHQRGEMHLRSNDGNDIRPELHDLQHFFHIGDYPLAVKELLQFVFKQPFEIDHLGNKVIITPGHLFYKLFRKTLYVPLLHRDASAINKGHKVIVKSIENGDLLHVLSKKTLFFKEAQVRHKMIADKPEQTREIGANDQVFVEKKTTCYRDVSFQNYQLIPYLSQMVYIQISSKVKSNKVLCFDESYSGFFCMFGTAETKNVGRQMMFTRDVEISVSEDGQKDLVAQLAIEPDPDSAYYLAVNSACIPIRKAYYDRIVRGGLLLRWKQTIPFLEAYVRDNFVLVNLKSGVPFKRFRGLWVTPNDLRYWASDSSWENDFPFVTSYYINLIPYFNHNAFPKNVLALNALKNAILATTPEYSLYFRETVSAYTYLTPHHHVVLEPLNAFSKKWTIRLPKLKVMFTSYRGKTQEDSIVVRKGIDKAFDCCKLYTLKMKLENRDTKYFYKGVEEGPKTFLGTLVCPTSNLVVVPQTVHVFIEKIHDHAVKIYFTKPFFQVTDYEVNPGMLFVVVQQPHACADGDKLCSLHGQKGVGSLDDDTPMLATSLYGKRVLPDLLVNPLSIISRQTMGQIFEMRDSGRDYDFVFNAQGRRLLGKALVGSAFYFLVNYLSSEHMYVANHCMRDKIVGQPVRGRSRQGGMRAGNMEIFNGFRGNGLAACYEEKLLENSDLILTEDDLLLPKSAMLCEEDAKFFKCTIKTEKEPLIDERKRRRVSSTSREVKRLKT